MSVPAAPSEPASDAGSERARAIIEGDVAAAARLISEIENDPAAARGVLRELFPRTGSAHLIGVTGPPGVGKSTLVAALVKELRDDNIDIGVIAVDPSSPFTGGALLGDRDRMSDFTLDAKVFVRSLAARGHGGGLCAAVSDAADVMDAMGKDVVLIETVGVGQGELEIARLAHTVILVLVPGYGDSLQAMKAGITEIADVIVINKSDAPGAAQTMKDLTAQGFTRPAPDGTEPWTVPIVMTSARRHDGIADVVKLLDEHRRFSTASGAGRSGQLARRTSQVLDRAGQRLRDELLHGVNGRVSTELARRLETAEIDPDGAAAELVEEFKEKIHAATKRTD